MRQYVLLILLQTLQCDCLQVADQAHANHEHLIEVAHNPAVRRAYLYASGHGGVVRFRCWSRLVSIRSIS